MCFVFLLSLRSLFELYFRSRIFFGWRTCDGHFFRKICKLREVFQQGNFTRVELPLILYPFFNTSLGKCLWRVIFTILFSYQHVFLSQVSLFENWQVELWNCQGKNFFVHLRIVSSMKFAKPETKLKLAEVEIYRTTAVLFSKVHSRSWAPGSVAKV